MYNYFQFILILLTVVSSKLFSQDILENQYNYALKLYIREQYYDAVTEFKRLSLFDTEKKYEYNANEYIGMSYKMGAKFSDAILFFTKAEMNARNNEELFNSIIEIVRINILRRTISHAYDLLDSLKKDERFTIKSAEIDYWKGWADIFNDNWFEAAKEFSKVDSTKFLAEFCYNVEKEKYSVSFADILSHIIPGAGQIYTGNYFSGILSLGWNTLWGYLTISAFLDNRVFDGLVIGNLLWLRFYNGNLQNSVKYAEKENLDITNRALDFLQSGYSGKKP
jgi:TM2 domain-containing membrane protein YozV